MLDTPAIVAGIIAAMGGGNTAVVCAALNLLQSCGEAVLGHPTLLDALHAMFMQAIGEPQAVEKDRMAALLALGPGGLQMEWVIRVLVDHAAAVLECVIGSGLTTSAEALLAQAPCVVWEALVSQWMVSLASTFGQRDW